MKVLKNLLILITLGIMITITGCGAQKQQPTTSGEDTQITSDDKKEISTYDASQNMRNALKDMKTQISNKEEDKAIETSNKLEENWSLFEDEVKDKDKDLYEKVESPLGIIQAAVKVKPIDTKVLITSIDQLDKVLEQIQKQ